MDTSGWGMQVYFFLFLRCVRCDKACCWTRIRTMDLRYTDGRGRVEPTGLVTHGGLHGRGVSVAPLSRGLRVVGHWHRIDSRDVREASRTRQPWAKQTCHEKSPENEEGRDLADFVCAYMAGILRRSGDRRYNKSVAKVKTLHCMSAMWSI